MVARVEVEVLCDVAARAVRGSDVAGETVRIARKDTDVRHEVSWSIT